eukprot:g70605.t1
METTNFDATGRGILRWQVCPDRLQILFLGPDRLQILFWVLSKFRTEPQVLQSLQVCQHVQCGQGDIQVYAHFVHNTGGWSTSEEGAGAKRVERIRRSWGWTLKKASVTNPEKYTDPSRLKYLDESHFENWDCSRWQWCRGEKGKEIVLVCRVPKIRKEAKVSKQTRRQRKQRCVAVVGEVRRMLGEEHRLTEAEVNDYDHEMVQEMYANYAALPDEKGIADIAYQALMHIDCNVMSDKQVRTLLRAVQHPFLSGQKVSFAFLLCSCHSNLCIVVGGKEKELTKEVNLKYDLKVSADGLSASANVYTILTELEAKWLKDGGGEADTLMIPVGGMEEKLGQLQLSIQCGEELEELKQSAGKHNVGAEGGGRTAKAVRAVVVLIFFEVSVGADRD